MSEIPFADKLFVTGIALGILGGGLIVAAFLAWRLR